MAKVALAKAEKESHAVWEKAKAELSKTHFMELRGGQRDWMEYRNHLIFSPTYFDEAGDEAGPTPKALFYCLRSKGINPNGCVGLCPKH